ncbi:hypothetical protein IEQ34_026219 [Dendrobium chrysotoxum]|uniref:Uncharacterized protein n=1 Tax=Dendrobium chrysotoxum TaxID=161865 RepID=A0AAV7FIQ3_DENCH|nr:hypothetical protein IEQ34_026219 [Dendrobium chrysotoxum]
MNPVHEAFGVDCSDVSTHLSAWHTLPVEASALLTLYSQEELNDIGSVWFDDRETLVSSGYDDPIVRVKGLGWLINGLILPAQQVWWIR